MKSVLETILIWTEQHLPDAERIWVSDLRSEANHISGELARQRFLWSGVLAAMGKVMRFRIGVQRVGQTLLGLALFTLCLGGLAIAPSIGNDVVRKTFYCVLPVYAVTGGLALLDLSLMKRFTLCWVLVLSLFWVISGLEFFTSMDAPVYFLRAFAVEFGCIMTCLFIVAIYLGWIEDADHA